MSRSSAGNKKKISGGGSSKSSSSANSNKNKQICQALNEYLKRMSAPCKVTETAENGKYVKAITDLPKGTVLFEEAALVSWGLHEEETGEFVGLSSSFSLNSTAAGDPDFEYPFCDNCLSPIQPQTAVKYNACPSMRYCCEHCFNAAAVSRSILGIGDVLSALRRFHSAIATTAPQQQLSEPSISPETKMNKRDRKEEGGQSEGGTGGEHGGDTPLPSSENNVAAVDDDVITNEKQSVGGGGAPPPISVEAVARCVVSIASRFVRTASAYRDAGVDLTEEVILQSTEKEPQPPLLREIFATATEQFDRFVEPPPASPFGEIEEDKWYTFIRDTLRENLTRTIAAVFSSPSGSSDENTSVEHVDGEKEGEEEAVKRNRVVQEVVTALLSDATLRTLLGQLSVNTQALNLGGGAASGSGAEDDVVFVADSDSAPSSAESGTDSSSSSSRGPSRRMVTRGAGIFTLQSCFNHSCDPNVVVAFNTDKENSKGELASNEIRLVTTRDVQKGAELCITYIPQLYLLYENVHRRREHLSSYFFECQCTKCHAEDQEMERERGENGEGR